MNNKNLFNGENAILDFLNPDKNNYLPLIEIPKELNPYYKDGVRIYAKLLNMLPLANVKSLPAFNMLSDAKEKGFLNGIKTLIENSSGNTVLSLAIIARLMGINSTKAFVSNEVLSGKLQMLRLFGVECIVNKEPICPDPADKTSGIYKAKRLGNNPGWFNAGQYENENNPYAHEKWTAKQIYEQLNGDIQIFCAGLGTTGTMVGCSRFFKGKDNSLITLGVIRTPNNPIPGVRTRGLLNMIAFDWKKHTDYFEEVGTESSFGKSLELIRRGLVVGPSSGFALSGLLQFIKKKKEEKSLDKMRNKEGLINAVFICCDSPLPYLEDYFVYLDDSYFPKIENEEILIHKSNQNFERKLDKEEKFNLEPSEVLSKCYFDSKEEIENRLKLRRKVNLKKEIVILDIRSNEEYHHYHLPSSINLNYNWLLLNMNKEIKKFVDKTVIVVCNFGLKSSKIVNLLRKNKLKAFNLNGGITEWSNLNLPRWKPNVCIKNKR